MITLEPIGKVVSNFEAPADPFEMVKHTSRIHIFKEYVEGLYRLEDSEFIEVTFHFHKSEGFSLQGKVYDGQVKGVFASRSPRRPSRLGTTTVKLMSVEGNEILVSGLDALDGTPVLDIKPCNNAYNREHYVSIGVNKLKNSPRWDIIKYIRNNELERLLLEAGKIHGHFCPGLSMGVMAATHAMRKMREMPDGMEDLLAITETNNCFADGVQLVTGCTFGNNALIFRDWGKNAFTLTKRDGRGIRVVARKDSRDYLKEKHPGFYDIFQLVIVEQNHDPKLREEFRKQGVKASFEMLKLDFDKIFQVQEEDAAIPSYAPIHDSIVCDTCGELTMASRIVEQEGRNLCLACAGDSYGLLTGNGIQ
ncbi:MAG: TrmO family methyltransferase domain-containing protein [Bacteroidota bacterium]